MNKRHNDIFIRRKLFSYLFFSAELIAISSLLYGCRPAPQQTNQYAYTYEVVKSHPHDPTAFTQGLTFHNDNLYEGTGGFGKSEIRKTDLKSGGIKKSRSLPKHYFGEGITVFDGKIIQLTWRSHTGFVRDLKTLAVLKSFTYPTEGWGLTHDDNRLIMSDGTSTLYFLNPTTFEVTGQLKVHDNRGSVSAINELEYVNGEILANVWKTDSIIKINPETGNVIARINMEGLLPKNSVSDSDAVLNGIAYDPKSNRLFVTGKLWPKLFEVKFVPAN